MKKESKSPVHANENGNSEKKSNHENRTDYSKSPSEKVITYHYCVKELGMTKEAAKKEAGYSKNTSSSQIEKSEVYKSVEQQRKDAAKACGVTMTSQVEYLQKVMGFTDSETVKDDETGEERIVRPSASMVGVGVQAAKEINNMMGFNAPKEVNMSHDGLFVELSGVASEELERIMNDLE